MRPGFLSIQRKFFDHCFWSERRSFSKAEAWLDLIQSAAFSAHQRVIRGSIFTIDRGEMVASLRFLGERWGWKKDKVASFVRLLETQTMITRETRQGETVIILCNYDSYNMAADRNSDSGQTETQTATRQRPDSDQTNKNKGNKETMKTPPNPQGGNDEASLFPESQSPILAILPAGWKRMKGAEMTRSKVKANTAAMNQIGAWFSRREGTLWNVAEAVALHQVNPPQNQIDGMGQYYLAEIPRDHVPGRRTALITLLNNWDMELDRARKFLNSLP